MYVKFRSNSSISTFTSFRKWMCWLVVSTERCCFFWTSISGHQICYNCPRHSQRKSLGRLRLFDLWTDSSLRRDSVHFALWGFPPKIWRRGRSRSSKSFLWIFFHLVDENIKMNKSKVATKCLFLKLRGIENLSEMTVKTLKKNGWSNSYLMAC